MNDINEIDVGTIINNLKIISDSYTTSDLIVECCIDYSYYNFTINIDDFWKCVMNNTIKDGYIYAIFKVEKINGENVLIYVE